MRFALMSNKFMSGAALFAALLCFSGDALAQSGRELGNRLSRLENEVETLSRAIYRGETPPPPSNFGGGDAQAQANTEIRLQQLELQIRELTGKLEEQTFETRQLKSELERMSTDMNMRLSDLEGTGRGGVTTNSGSNSNRYSDDRSDFDTQPKLYNDQSSNSNTLGSLRQNANASSGSDIVGDEAAASYENAFSLLKNGNYDAAEQEFETFLQNHENHALAGNAKYWLGETFYVRGDFERAARIFAEGYQKYPQGSKMADNLLKLGLSLSSIGNTKDACVALRQLKKDSPPNSGPVLRRADQEMSRLGC